MDDNPDDGINGRIEDIVDGFQSNVKAMNDLINELVFEINVLKQQNNLLETEKNEMLSEGQTMTSEVDSLQMEIQSLNEEKEMMRKELMEVRHENDLLVSQLKTREQLSEQAMSFAKSILQTNGIVNSLPTFSEQMVLTDRPNSLTTFGSLRQMENQSLRRRQSESREDTYHSTRGESNQNSKETTSDDTYYDADSQHRLSLTTTCTPVLNCEPKDCQQNQISSTVNPSTSEILNQSMITTTNSSSFGFDDNNNLCLKLVNVPIGRMIAVEVAFVDSPSNFWLHIDGNLVRNYIHLIQVKQEELAQSPNSRLSSADIEIGMYCAAIYTDGYWYRSQVIAIQYENPIEKDSIKTIEVLYVDWGNTEVLPLSKVMKLSPELNKRKQAIQCHLQGFNLEGIKWSNKAIEEFKHILENRKLSATFQKGRKLSEKLNNYKYPTDLMVIFDDETTENLINFLPIPEIEGEYHLIETIERDIKPIEQKEELKDQTIELIDRTIDSIDKRDESAVTSETLVCTAQLNSNKTLEKSDSNSVINPKKSDLKSHSNQNFATNCIQSNDILNVRKKSPKSMPQLNVISDTLRIPAPIIPEEKGLIVEASHLINPSLFYIHINDTQSGIAQFEDLEEQLNNYYSEKTTRAIQPSEVTVGSFWCCQFSEDKNWYRVRVIQVEENKILVNYIDYGNEEWVRVKDLRPLTRTFATYPALAVKCSLMNVLPIGSNEWPQESNQYFSSLINDKLLTAFVGRKPEDDFGFDSTLEIFLWTNDSKESTAKDLLINSHLVVNKYASTDNNDWVKDAERAQREKTPPEVMDQLIPKLNMSLVETSVKPSVNGNHSSVVHNNTQKVKILPEMPNEDSDDDNWDPMADDIACDLNNYGIPANSAEMATIGFCHSSRRTCKYFGTSQGCRLKDLCSFLHCDPNKRFALNDTEEEPLDIPDLELEVNSQFIMKVMSINSPFSFHGVLPFGTRTYEELIEDNIPEFEELKSLSESLKERYSKLKIKENQNIFHAIGTLVAYKDEQNNYFRGRIIRFNESDGGQSYCHIFSVDLGLYVDVKRSDTFKLEPYFCQFPALAIQCSLVGLEPLNSEHWSSRANVSFGEWTLNRVICCHIMFGQTEGKYSVELIDKEGEEDVYISNKLIAYELAQKVGNNRLNKNQSEEDIYDSDLD